jgi:hypothetical protein
MNRIRLINLAMPFFFTIFGLWIFVTSLEMGKIEGTFPRLIGIFVFVVALFQFYFDFANKGNKDRFRESNLLKVAEGIAVISLYVYLLRKIGYIIDTSLVSSYVMTTLGYRKFHISLPVAVFFSLGAFFIFKVLLGVPLPMIWLDF